MFGEVQPIAFALSVEEKRVVAGNTGLSVLSAFKPERPWDDHSVL